jgi:hypothetical protein
MTQSRTEATETEVPPDGSAESSPAPAGSSVPPAEPERPAPPSRPKLGRSLQVAGVMGLIASLLIIVVIWLARGWAVGQVDDVVNTLDSGLARAATAATTAADRIDSTAQRAGEFAVVASQAADAGPNISSAIVEAVSARLSAVADRYRSFRSSYGELRERVVSAIDTLQGLERFVPMLSVPQEPIDALASIDQQIQEIDSKVTDLVSAVGSGGVTSSAAADLASRANDAQAALTAASTKVRSVTGTIDTLKADVANAGSTASSVLTIVALVITVLAAYIAALHAALWVLGRRLRSS